MADIRSKRRVLVVDDDELMRGVLTKYLQRDGYEVVTAEDGAQGLVRIAEAKQDSTCFDLVISDFHMPRMTGGDLVRMLRAANIETPFILMSALVDTAELEGLDLAAFIRKPFDMDELRVAIRGIFS